jgi:hypothetical protein
MTNTEGLLPPADTVRGRNCGVTAVAILTGGTFAETFAQFRHVLKKSGRWKGRTTDADRRMVLATLNVTLREVPLPPLYNPAIAGRLTRRMTLERFVRCYAEKGVRYLVRTTGHVQVVRDGFVSDQCGCEPIGKFWGRRKRVTLVQVEVA